MSGWGMRDDPRGWALHLPVHDEDCEGDHAEGEDCVFPPGGESDD